MCVCVVRPRKVSWGDTGQKTELEQTSDGKDRENQNKRLTMSKCMEGGGGCILITGDYHQRQ